MSRCASRKRASSLTAVQDVSFAVARRRGGVADRAERLRQVHAAQHRLGPHRAERRRGLRRRRARRGAERPCRLHAAEGPAAAVAHRRRERHVRRRDPGRRRRPSAAARAGAARQPQARGVLQPLSAPAVRRHAPARGAGAHARGRSVGAAARRAVLGGRRADPHGAAARAGADAQARRQDRAADHPRPAGGRDAVRPRAGDEPAARPHHRRDRDRHARPRRSDAAPHASEGRRLRGPADGPPRHRTPSPRCRHERGAESSMVREGHGRERGAAGRVPGGVAMGAGLLGIPPFIIPPLSMVADEAVRMWHVSAT